jgi:hypothetical protein
MSTSVAIASQSNEGDQHLNTNPLPPPLQVNQGEAEFNQIEVQDWDEAEEEEAEADESELIRVQQEIERLRQEQESIMRRQEAAQCTEARRQHINKERVRLAELQYTVGILRQQEQRQDQPPDHGQQHLNTNPPHHLHQTTASPTKLPHSLSLFSSWTLTLIEKEDDTRSWGNFLVYFSHNVMST